MIYVLSKEWYDLLAVYLFRLQPVPYCEFEVTHMCIESAPAWQHFLFSFGLLPLSAFIVRVAFLLERQTGWVGLKVARPMAGMACGWSLGYASVEAIREMDDICDGCIWIKFLFALIATLVASVLVLVLQRQAERTAIAANDTSATHASPKQCSSGFGWLVVLQGLLQLLADSIATLVSALQWFKPRVVRSALTPHKRLSIDRARSVSLEPRIL